MKKIIMNYTHKIGSHCSSLQMSNLLRYHGLNLSEDLCFGIGAGLGFIYRKAFDPPLYFVLGRSDDLEEKICYHLGALARPYKTDDPVKAWAEVKAMIDRGTPAIINVDASYLEYMRQKFNLFQDARYGGHRLAVVGYDDELRFVYLYDYLWKDLLEVPFSEIEKARGSDTGQTPPNHLFYTFLFPKKFIAIEEAIRCGIRLNVNSMLFPWYEVLGLPGLKKFCQRVVSWKRFLRQDLLTQNVYMTYMMLEIVGTGGGNFRRIYARFIRQSSEILQNKNLDEVYLLYSNLSELWKEVAYLFLESSKDLNKGLWENPEASQKLLDEIYSKEEAAILLLKGIFC